MKNENPLWEYLKIPWNIELNLSDQANHHNDLAELGIIQPELGECVKRFRENFGENDD